MGYDSAQPGDIMKASPMDPIGWNSPIQGTSYWLSKTRFGGNCCKRSGECLLLGIL